MTDFLFGESPSQDITPTTILTPEQEELLRLLIEQISGGQGGETFGIETSPLELQSLAGLEALGASLPGDQTESSRAATRTGVAGLEALEELFGRDPTDFDEFFETNIRDPLVEDFNEDILGLGTRFSGSFFGGERREAERGAREDLLDALVAGRASTALSFRQQDTEAALNALGLLPGIAGFASTSEFAAPIAQGNILLGLLGGGGAERGVVQQQLNEKNRRLRTGLEALGIGGFENIVFNNPGTTGFIPSLVGAVAGNEGFGAAAGKFLFPV